MEPNISGQIRTAVFARGYQEPVTVAQLAMITGIGAGALSARIKAMTDHRIQIDGVMAGRDHLSRTCVWRSAPLPGHRITPWGQEVRDESSPTLANLKAAIERGDNDAAKAILMSGAPSLGAEINEAMFPSDSIHNPVVECCKRDAADCDCHPLAVMYVEARSKHRDRVGGDRTEEVEEMAREVAISVITEAGYGTHDRDFCGDPMGDTVQSLLMIAFMRVPSIGQVIEAALDKGGAITRKPSTEAEATFDANVEATTRKYDRKFAGLIAGKKYKVWYKAPEWKYKREAVMRYLDNALSDTEDLIWDARPAAGTQNMPKSWFIDATDIDPTTPCYIDKMIRD